MRFSLRNLGIFVAWIAYVVALVCQVRYEAVSRIWGWGRAPDVIWTVNSVFMVIVILLAIAERSRKRFFWIGCAVVAVTLVVFQAADLKPSVLSRIVAVWFLTLITPSGTMDDRPLMEGHVMQMASVLFFSLTPILSLLGGAFTVWSHQRSLDSELNSKPE